MSALDFVKKIFKKGKQTPTVTQVKKEESSSSGIRRIKAILD